MYLFSSLLNKEAVSKVNRSVIASGAKQSFSSGKSDCFGRTSLAMTGFMTFETALISINFLRLYFFQRPSISSSVFPFVSGTIFHTKSIDITLITPYRLYVNVILMCSRVGKVAETTKLAIH
jgi:hypothetical protein